MTFRKKTMCGSENDLDALLPRLRKAEPDAYSVLVRELSDPLYRFAVGMLGRGAVAEDLVQATFVRIYRSRKKLPRVAGLRGYAFRVLRNLALNHRRDSALRRMREREAAAMKANETEGLAREYANELWQCVAQLDRQLRDVIELRFAHGLTLSEVADVLTLPEGTVSTYQRKGLAELCKRASTSGAMSVLTLGMPIENALASHASPLSSLALPPHFISKTEAVLMAGMTTKSSLTIAVASLLILILAGITSVAVFDLGGDSKNESLIVTASDVPVAAAHGEEHGGSEPALTDVGVDDGEGRGEELSASLSSGSGDDPKGEYQTSSRDKSDGVRSDDGQGDHFADEKPAGGAGETENTEADPAIVNRLGGLSEFESPDRLVSVAFSPDNQLVMTASFGAQVNIWDRVSGKVLQVLKMKMTGALTQVAASIDGNYVAAAGIGVGYVGMWRVSDGSEVMMLAPQHEDGTIETYYTSLAFDPLGVHLYATGKSGILHVFNVKTHAQVESFSLDEAGVNAMTFSGDGELLYFAGGDGTLSAWDVSAQSLLYQQKIGSEKPGSLSLSADGNTLLIVYELSHASTYRADDGTLIAKLTGGGESSSYGVMHSQNPDLAVVADHFGDLELWNTRSATLLDTAKSPIRGFPALAMSRDEAFIAHIGDPGQVGIWTIKDEKLVGEEKGSGTQQRFSAIASFHQSNNVVVAYGDGSFEILSVPSGEVVHGFNNETGWGPMTMQVSQDDQWLVLGYGGGAVEVWNLQTRTRLHRMRKRRENIGQVALSEDGRYFFTADWIGQVEMWELLSGQLIRELTYPDKDPDNPRSYRCQALKVIGDLLIAGFDDRGLRGWDFITGDLRFVTPDAQRHWIKAIVGDIDHSWFASSCGWTGVGVWNKQGDSLGLISEKPAMVMALVGGKNRLALGRYDGSIEILDVHDLDNISQVSFHNAHEGWVQFLGITPDGRYAVSLGIDNSIAILDLEAVQDTD